MRQKPKVSVIIPVYNVEKYLRKCLDSIVNQTLRAIEIICVDDGSTDSSLQILQEYAAKDERIVVLTQKNLQKSIARNNGLDNAHAPYIMFVDSDDYLAPDMAEILYNTMVEHHPDVVVCDVENIAEDDFPENQKEEILKRRKRWFINRHLPDGLHEVDTHVAKQFVSVVWNKMYKTEIIRKFNLRFPEKLEQEDEFWLWAYMIHCKNFYFVDKKLYYYVIRTGSTMDTLYTSTKALDIFEQCKNIYKVVKNHKNIFVYKSALVKNFISFGDARKKQISPNLYPQFLEKMRDYIFTCNPSLELLEYYRKMQKTISAEQHQKAEPKATKKAKEKPILKQKNTFKLFNVLPILSCKNRGGKYVYCFLGIPFWKVRKMENKRITKYYLFGIPLGSFKQNISSETELLTAKLQKTNKQLAQISAQQNEMQQQLQNRQEEIKILQMMVKEISETLK